MINRSGSHLRVVWDKSSAPVESVKEPIQLNFLFDGMRNLVAVLDEDGLTGNSMCELLLRLRPECFLDIRACPRFDLMGYSRKKMFSDFARIGVEYYCLSSDEISDEIADRVGKIVAKLKNDLIGPIVVFVDRGEVLECLSKNLPLPKLEGGEKSKTGNWEFVLT